MLTMEQIEADMYQKMKITGRLTEKKTERGQREHIIRWFVDTQAALLLCDGNFPPWFEGFISRQEAEDRLRDLNVGCFLIRLSEKGIGYILSYKGQDRCRHFVINQTRTGLLIVSGDSTTHNSLKELIDHFKTTPIQPFGEYLTSYNTKADSVEKDSKNEVYDVVQSKPGVKLGVSVKALKSLWEQTSDVHHVKPSVMLSRSSRKLTTSTSFDRENLSEVMRIPPVPKKNAPLRNTLSADFVGQHPSHDQQSLFEPRTSGKTGVDGSRRRDPWDTEGGNFQLKWQENSYIPPVSIQTNPTNWSLSPLDKNIKTEPNSPTFDQCNSMSSSPPQPSTGPPRTASCSYALLHFEKTHTEPDQLPHTSQVDLQPNPLYQSVCVDKDVQPESDYDNRKKTTYQTFLFENTCQDIPDQHDNDTYEHIPQIQRNDTYEDIPMSDTNTYASLEELQPHTEKKNHKWWKFRPESKRK